MLTSRPPSACFPSDLAAPSTRKCPSKAVHRVGGAPHSRPILDRSTDSRPPPIDVRTHLCGYLCGYLWVCDRHVHRLGTPPRPSPSSSASTSAFHSSDTTTYSSVSVALGTASLTPLRTRSGPYGTARSTFMCMRPRVPIRASSRLKRTTRSWCWCPYVSGHLCTHRSGRRTLLHRTAGTFAGASD